MTDTVRGQLDSELILHASTAAQVQQFLKNPTHAVLLSGPDGIGKTALAELLMRKLLNVDVGKLAAHPHVTRIAAEDKANASISIEAIRELQRFLQLKTIGSEPFRRAVVIEHAQSLTIEAQNAFLKLLEEPPSDTIVILTVDSPRSLLPTILSRAQVITVHIPAEAQLQSLLARSTKDETTQRQAYFLSGRLPGLLTALLEGDESHPLLAGATIAKELLQKSTFERLAMVDGLSKQKETAYAVLDALDRTAQTGSDGAAQKQDIARLKQWHRIRKNTLQAREAFGRSANAKLALSNLLLQL